MKKILLALVGLAVVASFVVTAVRRSDAGPKPIEALRQTYRTKTKPSVDHALFTQLKGPFAKPQEVTAACISCHNERHTEVMASSHWNWARHRVRRGRGHPGIGKKNVLNNFCIGVAGNQPSCDKCHTGYGFVDA